jgi:predicted pyridoxine 5'-phosphate oxidase superfamily flavin-nucleotide-binding protein
LEENPKAFLFLMDYSTRRRLKIWGEARVVEGDDPLIEELMPDGYKAKAEKAILYTVNFWDFNCRQHIPQRLEADGVARAIDEREQRIAELEATIAKL